jgi:hypothetical protein
MEISPIKDTSPQTRFSFGRKVAQWMGWTRTSYYLMSAFILTIGLIIYIWWPLVVEYASYFDPRYPIWMQLDGLLLGIFFAMSLLITAKADIKTDAWIVFVGLFGGLSIESWGTQTQLWTYFTLERPPLWIIPAWPIASLAIDRLTRLLGHWLAPLSEKIFRRLYWTIFPAFLGLMLYFVLPTFDKLLTWMATLLVIFLIATPTDYRLAVITFLAGAGLGYFLERWGTTRECWTYYTRQTPPLFAVMAHGLAAVAFWRATIYLKQIVTIIFTPPINNANQ